MWNLRGWVQMFSPHQAHFSFLFLTICTWVRSLLHALGFPLLSVFSKSRSSVLGENLGLVRLGFFFPPRTCPWAARCRCVPRCAVWLQAEEEKSRVWSTQLGDVHLSGMLRFSRPHDHGKRGERCGASAHEGWRRGGRGWRGRGGCATDAPLRTDPIWRHHPSSAELLSQRKKTIIKIKIIIIQSP